MKICPSIALLLLMIGACSTSSSDSATGNDAGSGGPEGGITSDGGPNGPGVTNEAGPQPDGGDAGPLPAESSACSDAAKKKYVRQGGDNTTGDDWAHAYNALPNTLARGTTYCVAAGSYGSHDFEDAASGTEAITVVKATVADHGMATGWVDSYGEASTFANLSFSGTAYVLVDGVTVTGSISTTPSTSGTKLPSSTHHITLRNVNGKSVFIAAEDISVIGGSFGGFDGCDPARPEDIVQIWESSDSSGDYHGSTRVTFDGVTIHDITDHGNVCADAAGPAKGRHVDCMQILSGHQLTIKSSNFYNCATSAIIAQGFRDTLNDITVENNFFQQVQNPGATLNFAGGSDTISGTNVVQYNTVMGYSQFNFPKGGSVIVQGNILSVGSCLQGVFNHNVFLGGSAKCGTDAFSGTPEFIGPTPNPAYMNGIVPNYHLKGTDTVAKDRGNPTAYPATDIDGAPRFNGTAPDIGADEL